MKSIKVVVLLLFTLSIYIVQGQNEEQQKVIDKIIKEANENSELETLAHHLMDVIGPRLVGTPQMKASHDWVSQQYNEWGIESKNEHWGDWKAWNRGITHIDMVKPRVQSLYGTQLAWSPGTSDKGVQGEVVTLPKVSGKAEFERWLSDVKGKIVLISQNQITGRPDYNWEEFATEESLEKLKSDKEDLAKVWRDNIKNTGYGNRRNSSLSSEGIQKLEEAGALAIVSSYWSSAFGASKIFSASTKSIPTVNLQLEDYGMLYRLAESGNKPVIKIVAKSDDLGRAPTYNTLGTIKGVEKPNEYVMLSAHLDSWDGGTGATDNGTGTIIMMEAMRLLKKFYPNPKRTIIAGHWGSEEQGLNGSRSFVKDNPEVVSNLQALFNQDNGTGRVVRLSGGGFLHSYEFLSRWLNAVPRDITKHIETTFPGMPGGGGSDYASFLAAGAPGFSLSSLSWAYWNYTWHTNLDTYDKIVFDDVRNNAILTAILVYMACEDPESFPKEQRVMPISRRTGEPAKWPQMREPNRSGGKN